MTFNLSEIHKKIMQNKPNFYFYLGSMTTPPCSEYVLHLVIDKPLLLPPCQYKLLRENSLMTSRAKEIHTRLPKPLNQPAAATPRFKLVATNSNQITALSGIGIGGERTVYLFNNNNVDELPSSADIVPMSFNKYLVANGVGPKTLTKWTTLAKKYGPKSKWAKKLHRHILKQADRRKQIAKARQASLLKSGKRTGNVLAVADLSYGGDEYNEIDCSMPTDLQQPQ